MILINEWLPNPKGVDTKSEWIELWNNGAVPVNLAGWRLTADGKKFFTLSGVIKPGEHAALTRAQTKLTLKNTDGKLALYDSAGRLHDSVAFRGSAPEGESANRAQTGSFFGTPTPGMANKTTGATALMYDNSYPAGVPLSQHLSAAPQFVGFLLGTALALSAAVVFILKSHEDLSHLFLPRDQGSGRSDR